MFIETLGQALRRVRTTNATDNGFPTRLPTRTEPTGTGNNAAQASASAVINLSNSFAGGGSGAVQNRVIILPYGVGANNNTLSFRVLGWRYLIEGGDAIQAMWIPVPLGEFSVTLSSTPVGVAGGLLGTSQLFADTITLTGTTANDDISIDLVSPANDTIAHLVMDMKGFQKLEVIFTTGGSATSCNALVSLY